MDHICRNWGHQFSGHYCNQCGQSAEVPRFTFHHIVEEAFHAFTHADRSLLSFVRKLMANPGKLAYEYIVERKRKQYYNPFTFFVLITALYVFAESLDIHIGNELFHYNNTYGIFFNYYTKVLSLVTIPLVALFFWLIHYRKPKLLYSEYTVFAMILMSLYSVIGFFAHGINYLYILISHHPLTLDDNKIYLFLLFGYIIYADHGFHKRMSKTSWFPCLLSAVFFIAIQAAILVFIIWSYINDFQGIGIFYIYGIRLHW